MKAADQRDLTSSEGILVHDAEETRNLGAHIGKLSRRGDLILLVGDLGAGKTTFVQGLARGLGVAGQVTSPTYIVARVHDSVRGGPDLVHVDAYRLEDDLDLETIDLDGSLEDSVTVVEWGRGKAEALQNERLEIEFEFAVPSDRPTEDEPRRIRLLPIGDSWGNRLQEAAS